ncbi:NUDIX domain-containing protein [Streptomyces lavendulae]|uniref:NUDIX domain-containing protein n=1 Tax=Streptomyces lavendulae TaxID=1914 RepID=UPI003723738D
MSEKVTKEKVLVYVVRDGRLLVFRHSDYSYEEVGIQVPAGSIRPGETPEAAALREAREETGLAGFEIVRELGETEYDISPYRFEIQSGRGAPLGRPGRLGAVRRIISGWCRQARYG